MQSISLHIEYLLRAHECVILPGIGAFLRSYKAATISDADEVCAPGLQICFNSSIVASDGLLCHSIARREKITFEEAAVYVSKAVEECRAALDVNGELSIGRLGRLMMDAEQRISFLPYTRQYGQIWNSFKPLAIDNNAQSIKDSSTQSGVVANNDKDYYIIRISRKAVRYAAIATICLLTATTMLLPSATRNGVRNASVEKQYASVLPGVEKLSVTPKSPVDTPTQQAPVVENAVNKAQDDALTVPEELSYYLIVATFKNEADCHKFIAAQADKDDLAIVNSGKVSRVYSAASNNRQELLDMLNSSAHKSKHPQAWIWTNPAAHTNQAAL